MSYFRIIFIVSLVLISQSCRKVSDSRYDATTQEVLELRNLFWQTGDTTYLYQGVSILDSLFNSDLSQKDYTYCANLMEQLYLDMGKLRKAMALRIQVTDSVKHPEDYYEAVALISYCNNEISKMKDYSSRASLEFERLAKESIDSRKVAYLQRQIDTNILCCNYQKADSLYLLLIALDKDGYHSNFGQYYAEVHSNLEKLKQQFNNCGE